VIVIEQATRDNFCAQGYLWMNADVAAHKPPDCDDESWAWRHFSEYGEGEGWRKQLSLVFMEAKDQYARTKFERFQNKLMADDSNAGGFKFLDRAGSFPVAFSNRYFSRKDYMAESTNDSYGPFVEEILANPHKCYLDLGCGLRPMVQNNCLYLEVYPSLTADVIVEPNCRYPFRSQSFDGIGCFAVLEHVTKPWQVVTEIHRMLKPGGKAYIVWPFLQPVHGYPSHYYNATREGLKLMFEDGFNVNFCGTDVFETPDFTVTWILRRLIDSLPIADQDRVRRMSVGDLVSQPPMGPFWKELLSKLSDDVMSELACGNTLIATKRSGRNVGGRF
jgi:SAM-dependent methyltransferase